MNFFRIQLMFLIVWSVANQVVIWPVFRLLSIYSDKIRKQLKLRRNIRELTLDLARVRRQYRHCVVFFCSSAGEYEQAKPIIDRLGQKKIWSHIFFFSASGAEFVVARKDKVSWSMAPADSIFLWGSIFAALRPNYTIVVRHELWPAFLWSARQWSTILLINGTRPSLWGRQPAFISKVALSIKTWFLSYVEHLYLVNELDRPFFEDMLMVAPQKLICTGDTKYDRVLERASEKMAIQGHLRRQFHELWTPTGCSQLLVAGSVHMPDCDLIVSALKDPAFNTVKVLLVPHDISSHNIGKITTLVKNSGFTCELLSDVENASFEFSKICPRILIADEMGRLSDLYSVGDISWVGGAIHHKIHNILEPAAWGLPIFCGKHFQNSPEAVALDATKLLFAVKDHQELVSEWKKVSKSLKDYGCRTKGFAQSLAGASDKIVQSLIFAD